MKASASLCLVIFSFLFCRLSAQTALNPPLGAITILPDSISRKVSIEFESGKEIYNLLVLVTDHSGMTLFLDNQYRFNGKYKKTVDLQAAGTGDYAIKIIRDEDAFQKHILFR
jgi:hypothetical protein